MRSPFRILTLQWWLLLTLGAGWPETLFSQPSHEWAYTTPQEAGFDGNTLEAIHQEIERGDYGLIDHFIVIRNGKIIVDHQYLQDYTSVMRQYDTTKHIYNYDHVDWHPYLAGTKLHSLQSVTKSITSILLGIAMDDGLLDGAHQPVLPYFAGYEIDESDSRRKSMIIEDLLTMRSGISWDEENYDEAHNSCILMEASENWIQFVLDHELDRDPGSTFEYNSGASVLLGKIVREATGHRLDKWAEKKLFGPLGIENYYWKETPKGEIDSEGGLYLSAHDLAKIGMLMLQKGEWNNKKIISSEWVSKSTAASVSFNGHSGYGYQWWVPLVVDGKTEIFAGNGYGGQFLQIVPKHDLVVVFNGWQIHGRAEKSSWNVLQDRILPALR